ncbi:MAG: response regulator [Pseudomonadota bacterium]
MAQDSATILVVDDDDEIRRVLQIVLQKSGHVVVQAANGEEALARMVEHVPDLVLLDIMLPRLDGLEVIRRMREQAALRSIPVIAFTALTSQLIEKELFELGVKGFMRKPLRLADLKAMIANELSTNATA